MSEGKELYFIALVLPEENQPTITALKEEMHDRFNAKHALKSPPHITLQMPFRRSVHDETKMVETLEAFAKSEKPFEIQLEGFGCFTPRVIFVKVKEHDPIVQLHDRLAPWLINELEFSKVNPNLHPHVTIATRDLSHENFHKAWSEFESREYADHLVCEALHLLKHNGQSWDILREFPFGA